VLHRAQEIHAAIDDEDVQCPEQKKREPLTRGMPSKSVSEERGPRRDERLEQRLQRLAPNPRLNRKPPARDVRPHECRHVRAERAVGGARKYWKWDPVFGAGM